MIYASLVTDIENICYRGEVESRIALDEHDLLGAGRKDAFQLIQ